MGNNLKALRVHALRRTEPGRIETECGTIGRTFVEAEDTWRTALGNPFKIGPDQALTCPGCKRWVKVRK